MRCHVFFAVQLTVPSLPVLGAVRQTSPMKSLLPTNDRKFWARTRVGNTMFSYPAILASL